MSYPSETFLKNYRGQGIVRKDGQDVPHHSLLYRNFELTPTLTVVSKVKKITMDLVTQNAGWPGNQTDLWPSNSLSKCGV